MSKNGLLKTANIFFLMQQARGELLEMGAKNHDKQDILLGQLLEVGKDAMAEKFEKLTLMEE